MTHNERCRAIAEQMAKDLNLALCMEYKVSAEQMIGCAEIAVQFGADMLYKFMDSYCIGLDSIETTLTDLGLVKPNDIQVNGDQ